MAAEPSRSALYARLVEVLGDKHAMTLMDALPPTGSEFATRSDIERLEQRVERLEHLMERFDDRLHGFHGALREQTRTFMIGTIGSMTTLTALAFAAATIV